MRFAKSTEMDKQSGLGCLGTVVIWGGDFLWVNEVQRANPGQNIAGGVDLRRAWNHLYFCPDALGAGASFPGQDIATPGEVVEAAGTDAR